MTDAEAGRPEQFRFLATFIAGRTIDVAWAAVGQAAHTDGHVIFVTPSDTLGEHRHQVLLQSALLGAGSLDPLRARALRARPNMARRYLRLEGNRVLRDLGEHLPLAAAIRLEGAPTTTTAEESLELARSSCFVPDPPDWFGVIKPARLLGLPAPPGTGPSARDLRLTVVAADDERSEDDLDSEGAERSAILKLFENPLMRSRLMSDFMRKLFGTSRSRGDDAAGAELAAGALRRVQSVSPRGRPLPTQLDVTDGDMSARTRKVDAALHPEWDVFNRRYRPDWCRVSSFPLTAPADISAAGVAYDDVLRRRLSRVGLGPIVLSNRADGDELDIDALIELVADIRSGHSPPHNVYTERRKRVRDLSVLVLLDASGSVSDTDQCGQAAHEHQRRAAATLTATLEELGDRVALYAFRSQGRHNVQLLGVKTFEQRFTAAERARLNQLQPSGYTRLGAVIRGAADVLTAQAGTRNRLILLLTDGFPYDYGYEGWYAEADVRRALEELRSAEIACLCLTLGGVTDLPQLERVFGTISHAYAATLAELSPRMDELFQRALRELAALSPSPNR